MKRPALWIGFPYVLGLCLAAVVTVRWIIPGCLLLIGMIVLLWRRELWKYVLLSTLSLLTACCVYWQADAAASAMLHHAGTESVFTGSVMQYVRYPSGWTKYVIEGDFGDGEQTRAEWFTLDADHVCGDLVTLAGTPEALDAGYLFDSRSYARSQGITLQFSDDAVCTASQSPAHRSLRSVLRQWRAKMSERIRSRMGNETGTMLTGMLFGDKSGMAYSERSALTRMGIGHVLAVSGLHLDFLAGFAAVLLKKLRAGRKLTFAVMCVLCVLFVLCAGETVAVTRACIMILIRQLGAVLARRADALNSLSIAVLLLGAANPFVIHGAAFWLSATATFGIAVVAPYMTKTMQRDTFLQSFAADIVSCFWCFAAVLPVSVICFREVSLLSPLSNTFLIPVCMGAMLFGVLALVFGCQGEIAGLFLDGADVMNGWILRISELIAAPSWTQIPTGSRMLPVALLAGVVLIAVICFISRSRRLTAFTTAGVLAVSGISVRAEHLLRQQDLRMAMLGETATGLLVLTDGEQAVLLDLTGRKNHAAYAQAYLSQEGIGKVSELVLCKPSDKSLRQYEGYLVWQPPESVCCVDSETELVFRGAKVTADAHGAVIEYAGNTYQFTNNAGRITEPPEVLCLYGKQPAVYPECGVLIVPEGADALPDAHTYIGEEALELTAASNGTCRIRRLYGEN